MFGVVSRLRDMRRIKNSAGCLPFSLWKGYAANFTEWFETVVVSFICTRDDVGKRSQDCWPLKQRKKCLLHIKMFIDIKVFVKCMCQNHDV